MEPLQLALLNAKLNLIENEHGNDLTNLPQEAKAELLPFVVDVASCYIEEEREQHKLEKGLRWAQVALSLGGTDESRGFLLQAKLLEATAIDKLDHAEKIEQPLAFAISRLREVVRVVDALKPPSELEAALRDKAASLLQDNIKDSNISSLAVYALRRRLDRKLRPLIKPKFPKSGPNAIKTNSPCAHYRNRDPMEVVRERKGRSRLRVMRGMTAAGLGLDDDYDDLPVPKVLAAWRELGAKQKGPDNKAKRMEEFMLLADVTPPPYSLELLKQHDAFRRGDVESLSIVSWNAQLMNILDGPNDADIENAIKWKAKSIGKVVARPGGDAPPVSLLVIQEAPGPQLRDCRKGSCRRRVADENLFTNELERVLERVLNNELEQELPRHFEFRQVALSNIKNDREKGEDHIYCWDPQVMGMNSEGPMPLAPPENKNGSKQKWVGRAPSYALFKVKKWGASLLVVSVHAKSVENNSTTATENDVRMIGRAVQALQDELEANNAAVDSVVIVGDFNLPPDKAAAALKGRTPAFGDKSIPTNIWLFNGTGIEREEGHAYDHGFFSSRADLSGFTATLASASEQDVVLMHKEMKLVAKIVCDSLELESKGGELETGAISTEAAKRALRTIKDLTGVKDGVPSWLRQMFQKEVKLFWSDHLPIVLTITMLKAEDEGVEESKGN